MPIVRLAALAAALGLAACGDGRVEQAERGLPDAEQEPILLPEEEASAPAAAGEHGTVVDVLRGDDRFGTLLRAVEASGLAPTLADGDLTVFAPTDEAFAALPAGTLETLMQPANRAQLADLVRYHLVEGRAGFDRLRGRTVLRTTADQPLEVTETSGRFRVGGEGGAVVTSPGLPADDGVIHVVDAVLLPPAG